MLTVSVESDTDLLTGVQQRIDDPRPALELIATHVRSRESVLFASNGRGSWPALDPETAERKGNNRVLVERGVLRASLTRPGARYAVSRFTDDELVIGTRDPVARLHRRGARGMPVRDPVPTVTDAERRAWGQDVADYVINGTMQ